MLSAGDQVVLINRGESQWKSMWDGKQYGCPPNMAVHVPFELVCKDFGDPRSGPKDTPIVDSRGEKGKVPSRKSELDRLEVLYGVEASRLDLMLRGHVEESQQVNLRDRVPNVSITDIAGNPIPTVIEDPSGVDQLEVPIDVNSPEAVAAKLAKIEQEQQYLKALLAQHRTAEETIGGPAGSDVTEDIPRT